MVLGPLHFAAVAMPGRNLQDGRNPAFSRFAQREQAIARPTVKQVEAPAREMPRRDPVEIFLLGPVVIWTCRAKKEDAPDASAANGCARREFHFGGWRRRRLSRESRPARKHAAFQTRPCPIQSRRRAQKSSRAGASVTGVLPSRLRARAAVFLEFRPPSLDHYCWEWSQVKVEVRRAASNECSSA